MTTIAKTAVLLVNLGSPATPGKAGVRAFLTEFLSDPRVIEIPRWLWLPLLRAVILPLRLPRVTKLYQSIWTSEGSPLIAITRRQAAALGELLSTRMGNVAPEVTCAMTYGTPALGDVIKKLQSNGVGRIIILPMYPQYSATTTAAAYDALFKTCRKLRNIPELILLRDYCDHPAYLAALAASISDFWQEHGRSEHLLFSFHGIPLSYVDAGDPYPLCCDLTAQRTVERLKLPADTWSFAYQSRFGKAKWLQPYTSVMLQQLAQRGIKTVDVVCPAFAADCLETLEEIAIQMREIFEHAGGERLRLVPCLNDNALHIEALAQILAPWLQYTRVDAAGCFPCKPEVGQL